MKRGHGTVACAAAMALMGGASAARADEVAGTRSELLVEREHAIELRMDYDHAKLVVRRTVFNGGERHDQALFWIDLPDGAVATGLRTLGTLRGRPKWFDGELLEAEMAAERYRELTGIGGYYPKDPALLSWRSQTLLALQVFPVEPGGPKTIEYTLHLPTLYEEGRYRVALPPMGTDERPAALVSRPVHRRDQLFVDGEPVGTGTRISLDRELEISIARADAPLLDGRLASYRFADEAVLVRYEMNAAARLSEVPRGARVVVLIDTSRSMGESDLEGSIAAARAYLGHFAAARLRARAEVVTFDRRPTRRHAAMLPVDRVLADLETFDPPRRNGSHVDAALERALDILDEGPAGAPRRIVVFTDTLTRSSLTPARLQAIASRGRAIVHVVDLDGGVSQSFLQRDDNHDWGRVARATGGLVWSAGASASAGAQDEMRATFEELARPIRLDRVRVVAPGLPSTADVFPETLDEGEGFGDLLVAQQHARHLRLEGELWSRPIREIVTPSAEHGKLWAGLVFGTELLHALTETQMMRLAMHGRVVSPVTSYLAIEPGVRPSTEGLDPDEGFMGIGGMGLVGRGGGGGTGSIGHRQSFDHVAWLEARLHQALRHCGARHTTAAAELETTLSEVADITALEVEPADSVTDDCVREAIWSFELPVEFRVPLATWTIQGKA